MANRMVVVNATQEVNTISVTGSGAAATKDVYVVFDPDDFASSSELILTLLKAKERLILGLSDGVPA